MNFRYPSQKLPTSCGAIAAAGCDSRRASARIRFARDGWFGCVDRVFSRHDQGYGPCRKGPLQLRDSYFPPSIHPTRVWRVKAAADAEEIAQEMEARQGALRAPTKVDAPPACARRNRRRAAARRQVVSPWPEVPAGKGDESHLPAARRHAIHLRHGEARRPPVCGGRYHTAWKPPKRRLRGPAARSAEPQAPRRLSVCRRIFADQPRKDSPHSCRKSPVIALDSSLRCKAR